MKNYAQTLVEVVLIAGITVVAILVAAAIMSENVRAVFQQSAFTNLMHRKETTFENPNKNIEAVELQTPQTTKAEDL